MEERKKLVESEELPSTSSYGTDIGTPPSPPNDSHSDAAGAKSSSRGKPGPTNGQGKKERLHRAPSLDKVDEDVEKENNESSRCGNFSYGVKSYLHHFYDSGSFKDPSIYEDDYQYLLPNRRRRICNSIWWKVFVWIGANFLVFGTVGVLVGYLVPPRPIIIASTENLDLKDNNAEVYNFKLDVCKLVGLALFCMGGVTLTLALLFPILMHQYCDDDRSERPFQVRINTTESTLPTSPLENRIPATPQLASVQPGRNNEEAIITKDGMVPFKE